MSDDKMVEQLELELRLQNRGKERYYADLKRNRENGHGYREGFCDRYMRMHCLTTAEARSLFAYKGTKTFCEGLTELMYRPRPGRGARGMDILRETAIPAEDLTAILLPHLLHAAGEGITRNSLAAGLAAALEDEYNHRAILATDAKAGRSIKRQASKLSYAKDRRYKYAVEAARQLHYRWEEFDRDEIRSLGIAIYAIAMDCCSDAVEEYEDRPLGRKRKHRPDRRIRFTGQFAEREAETHEYLALEAAALGPLLVPPSPWTDPVSGGYYGVLRGRTKAVHSALPGYQRALRSVWNDEAVCVQALNKQQDVAYRINTRVCDVWREVSGWADAEDYGIHASPLVSRPRPPMRAGKGGDEAAHKAAWSQFNRDSRAYEDREKKANSKRITHRRLLSVIDDYAQRERFYYANFLDWRGRMYVVDGCGMSYQGGEVIKGLIQFADGERVGARGIEWLKVHAANTFGEDKMSFAERITWTEAHMEKILVCADAPLDNAWWRDADSPWEFLSVCIELAGCVDQGEDFISHCIVGMDGTCNGSQHMAAMVRCRETAARVNLIPNESPNDLYGDIAVVLKDRITLESQVDMQEDLEQLTQLDTLIASGTVQDASALDDLRKDRIKLVAKVAPALLFPVLEYVDRKLVKTNVMTSTYNVSGYGMRKQLRDCMYERFTGGDHRIPAEYVSGIAVYVQKAVDDALAVTLGATVSVMNFLKGCAKIMADRDIAIQWHAPSGMWINHSYPKFETKQMEYRYQDKRIKIRMNSDTANQDTYKAVNGISANYTHSLDASHLALTVLDAQFSLCTIHDSYGCHACNVEAMRESLGRAMVELYSVDRLAEFREGVVSQLKMQIENEEDCLAAIAELPTAPERGTLSDEDILGAGYMFA